MLDCSFPPPKNIKLKIEMKKNRTCQEENENHLKMTMKTD